MEWIMKMDNAPCRVNHAAVAVDDCIYSFGGYVSGEDYKDSSIPIEVFILNTRSLKWTTLLNTTKAPFRRYGHSVVAHGRNVYLWGGRNDTRCDGTLYCFDTVTLSWSLPQVSGSVPMASDGHAACINKDTMYIHGGYVEAIGQFTRSLHALNLNTFVWTVMPPEGQFPGYRDFHTMSCHPDGHLLVFGGREMVAAHYSGADSETYPNNLHMYNVQHHSWISLPCHGTLPTGRRSHSAFVHEGKLYIFAGFNSRLGKHMNDFHSYNLKHMRWQSHPMHEVQPSPRRRQALCTVGNLVYMFGGTHPDTKEYPLVRSFPVLEEGEKELLEELSDLWVMEFNPSLTTRCLLRVVRSGISLEGVPLMLQRRAAHVPRYPAIQSQTVWRCRYS